MSCGAVAGEAVVQLEGGAREAAAVHGADDDLVLQGAEEQQVLQDVGGGEHAVDAGAGEREAEAFQQVDAVGHGEAASPTARAPRAGWSAAMIISRPPGAEQRAACAAGGCLRDGLGVPRAGPSARSGMRDAHGGCFSRGAGARRPDESAVGRRRRSGRAGARGGPAVPGAASAGVGWRGRRPRRGPSTSAGNGIADGTGEAGGDDGPGGVGVAHDAVRVPAGQQPVAEGAAERVAGAEAVDHLDGEGRDLGGGAVAVDGEDARRVPV